MSNELMSEMLRDTKSIAVVGLSDNPERSSNSVTRAIMSDYRIIPINPNLESVLGETCYPSLTAVPDDIEIDLVNIFRRSEFVPSIVEGAISRGTKYIWMQQGVVHEEAARNAEKHGIKVVMDSCIAVMHRLLAK